MRASKIYLEAPGRSQDLLNVKWALRSAGYSIGSTWHEIKAPSAPDDHWNQRSLEQLQFCDSLVVVCASNETVTPELAMMAGFALARGIRVFWIGLPIGALCDFRAVQHFNTAEDFRKQVLSKGDFQPASRPDRLAA